MKTETPPNLISREAFARVAPTLDAARKQTRPRIHDLYDITCAILYKLQYGIAWRNLPGGYPKWRSVHEYFLVWRRLPHGDGSLLDYVLRELDDCLVKP